MVPLEIRLRSDATQLNNEQNGILVHVVTDALTWGLGFTQAIEARWPLVAKQVARHFSQLQPRPTLGSVFYTPIDARVTLAHLVAERARGNPTSVLDLEALSRCFAQVAERALATGATVHAPPLGTGLSTARWQDVRAVFEESLAARGVAVVVHCLGNRLPPTVPCAQ